MTATLRRPAAVGVLVALVVVGGWWKMLWQPQGDALAKAHRQTQAASTNLFTVEQNIGHLKHLQAISAKLTALEKSLSAAAPTSDGIDEFLLTLNDLVLQSGVTPGTISLSPPTASAGGLATISVRLSVTGDYFAVQHFLDTLRGADRIVVIDSLAETPLKATGKGAPSGGVSAAIAAHLLTGLTPPPAAVAAVLAAPPTTAAPTGIISGPVTKARNAVANANANTAQVSAQANQIGGP